MQWISDDFSYQSDLLEDRFLEYKSDYCFCTDEYDCGCIKTIEDFYEDEQEFLIEQLAD